MNKHTNFDILLYLAAEECAISDVEKFLALDDSNVIISSATQRKAKRIIRRSEGKSHPMWSTIKYAAVACLIIMSICFTACICIPKVREAIKEVFVEWYEGYIAIGFTSNEEDDTDPPIGASNVEVNGMNIGSTEASSEQATTENETQSTEPDVTPPLPPTTIEKKAYATYLPEGYVEEVKYDNLRIYQLVYLNDGILQFILLQKPIDEYLVWADSENQNIQKVYVQDKEAILTIHEARKNTYNLVWQTSEYEYQLSGTFSSIDELIKIAEGITTK